MSALPNTRDIRWARDGEDNHPRLVEAVSTLLGVRFHHCADFTTGEERDIRNCPGWVKMLAQHPSLLTLSIRTLPEEKMERVIRTADGEPLEQHIRFLRSILQPTLSSEDPQGLDGLLPRSDRRHGNKPNLREQFDILTRTGWRPPSRGTVLQPPDWHPIVGRRTFLVVSNTGFNTRFYYPDVLTVTLTPLASLKDTAETLLASGHLVVGPVGRHGMFRVNQYSVSTFSFACHWHGVCPRHPFSKNRPERWLIEGGPSRGRCLKCDRTAEDPGWPKHLGTLLEPQISEVATSISKRLGLVPP